MDHPLMPDDLQIGDDVQLPSFLEPARQLYEHAPQELRRVSDRSVRRLRETKTVYEIELHSMKGRTIRSLWTHLDIALQKMDRCWGFLVALPILGRVSRDPSYAVLNKG